MSKTIECHSAFEFIRQHSIESLNINVQHFKHKVTGAEHYHLAADDPQNVFMVALRTVPMDSTGVAHILEHTVLCGSEKYPVRDPFFMMIRRSLNTFMNAFTSSDWTAYPFATENRKDFQNLLQVYMDAVFFPNLDALDFAQEGHRFEFAEPENPASDLTYKGVVFNEMKGAMSSPVSTLWQTFTTELYPTSTYHYNSGGEPKDIPDLTHQQLVDFHKLHYHPSNAVFMTYGDITAAEHQTQFEALGLSRFKDKVDVIKVPSELRLTQPKKVVEHYALDEESLEKKTHIVLGWLLGENKNELDVLKGHLLEAVLLDNSASPLRKVLEETDLASAPSPLCGLEDSNKEMVFAVGVQGSEAEHTDAVEALILNELQRIAKEGVDADQVEAMLHQLELSQREIGGDSYPYGLQLILQSLAGAMHDGDPIALLDTDKALLTLGEAVKHPRFIPDLVQEWLLDNPHRICLTLVPAAELSAKQDADEKAKLAKVKAGLSEAEAQAIVDLAAALKERQEQEDDPSILPEVTKDDVPADIKVVPAKVLATDSKPYSVYEAGTNGIVYEQLLIDLPDLTDEEKAVLPVFHSCLPELGSGGRDYLQTQSLQAAVTGGLSAKSSIRANIHDVDNYHSHTILSGKALNRNHSGLADLMQETLQTARFDETDRIKDLLDQIRSSIDHGVTGSGHSHAMRAAMQNFSPVAKWQFDRTGFEGIKAIKALHKSVEEGAGLEKMIGHFESIRSKLMSASKQALLVSDETVLDEAYSTMQSSWDGLMHNASTSAFQLTASHQKIKQAWITSTQVNFCAKAYPAVTSAHPDAPKLSVLGACLRNGFLHSAVREKGGAYGGGAAFNAESASFCFYSYRDPRLLETYEDFDSALGWLLSNEATQAQVEEAILNVISAMDKPGSPAGEAKKAFYQQLYGRSHDMLMAYREGVLSTTLADLREVAQKYILPEKASFAVLTSDAKKELLQEHAFDIFKL
ncbi:insulinase family protein [Hydrogenovibrio marinus]|uniref:Peptidase M16 n=1 Tax=Hydrogenovibrio marinus TaxID=28885 RepID=A0A066ZMN3_HYDMR|nr:insulinase family protein [Hydrogenovibrio marinus]KDN95078.1 peptidase M16 [Hydrogenovibrio marinus]BBN59550.1 peptidase M16 [Hydrogenovibrio marinus]